MRTFTVENTNGRNYLIYKLQEEEKVDEISVQMLKDRSIQGFLHLSFSQMNKDRFFKYDVTSLVPVSEVLEYDVNRKKVLGIFGGIVDALLSAEEYMLIEDTILLDVERIYVNLNDFSTKLVCLPLEGIDSQFVDPKKFFKSIIMNATFSENENNDYVTAILNFINSGEYSLEKFKNILNKLQSDNASKKVEEPKTATQTKVQEAKKTESVVQQPKPPVKEPVAPKQPSVNNVRQPQPAANNIQHPGVNIPDVPQVPKAKQEKKEGTEMSLMYLLRHYSKENIEIYKNKGCIEESSDYKPKDGSKPEKKNTKKQEPVQSTMMQGVKIPGRETPSINAAPEPPSYKQKQPQPATKPAVEPKPVYKEPEKPVFEEPKLFEIPAAMNFGETIALPDSCEETVMLDEDDDYAPNIKKAYLIRRKNQDHININMDKFVIGKDMNYANYFISDNTAISRMHCKITLEDGQYYITDTGSRNHTRVNGRIIQPEVKTAINDGDELRLANEEFEFYFR